MSEEQKWTLDRVKAEVLRMDDKLSEADVSFMAAVCLLSGLVVGARSVAVARFTGYPMGLVKEFSGRLRSANVWTANGGTRAEWFDEKHGGIAFWCDVAVAQGLLTRVKRHRSEKRKKS